MSNGLLTRALDLIVMCLEVGERPQPTDLFWQCPAEVVVADVELLKLCETEDEVSLRECAGQARRIDINVLQSNEACE